MPCGCRSRAITWASPRIANFAGPNAADVANGFMPAVAPVKMIVPLPRLSIAGTTSCAAMNAPKVVTRQVFSNVLGLVSISLPNGRIAALYSSASTSPSSRRIFSNAAAISAALATSAETATALPPPASISLARAASLSSPRATNATAYSSANFRASAAPNPGPTPITTQIGRRFDSAMRSSCARELDVMNRGGTRPPHLQTRLVLRCRFDHRVRREEVLVDRAHVDVPAFALRSLKAGQVAHSGEPALDVSRDRADFELALERINRHARIRHRTIAIGRPPDVIQPELTLLIVFIDIRLVPHLRVHIDDGLALQRLRNQLAARRRLDDIHVAHLPRLRTRAGATVSRALQLRRVLRVCDPEHRAIAEKFVVVFLGLGVEARVVIRVPGLRAGRSALQRLVQAANPARAGIPAPIVVAAVGLLIAKADESLAALGLRRKARVKTEQP